jgi:hypothetical protein
MNLMRKLFIPLIATGAVLTVGALPASAAVTTAVASPSHTTAAATGRAQWVWVYKGLYGSPTECQEVGETFSPFEYECLKYSIGARPGDYEWELLVRELT